MTFVPRAVLAILPFVPETIVLVGNPIAALLPEALVGAAAIDVMGTPLL